MRLLPLQNNFTRVSSRLARFLWHGAGAVLFVVGLCLSTASADTQLYGLSIKNAGMKPIGNGLVSVSYRDEEIIKSAADASQWIALKAFQNGLLAAAESPADIVRFIATADKAGDAPVASLGLAYLLTLQAKRTEWLAYAAQLKDISPKVLSSLLLQEDALSKRPTPTAAPAIVELRLPYNSELDQAVLAEMQERLMGLDTEAITHELQLDEQFVRSDEGRKILANARRLSQRLEGETINEISLLQLVGAVAQQPWSADFLYPVLQQRVLSLMDRGVFSEQESVMLLLSWPQNRVTPEIKGRLESFLQRDSLDYHWFVGLSADQRQQFIGKDGIPSEITVTMLTKSLESAVKQRDFSVSAALIRYLVQLRPDPNPANDRLRFILAKEFLDAGHDRVGYETIDSMQTPLTLGEKVWLYQYEIITGSLSIIVVCLFGVLIFRKIRATRHPKGKPLDEQKSQVQPATQATGASAKMSPSATPNADKKKNETPTEGPSENTAAQKSFVQLDPNRHLVAIRQDLEKCLAVLGASPDSNASDIKKAFRDRMKNLHPDMLTSGDSKASSSFMDVNQAYEKALALRKQLDEG